MIKTPRVVGKLINGSQANAAGCIDFPLRGLLCPRLGEALETSTIIGRKSAGKVMQMRSLAVVEHQLRSPNAAYSMYSAASPLQAH